MQDWRLAGVEILKEAQDMISPTQHVEFGKRFSSRGQQLGQISPRDELHHEKLAVILTEIIHYLGQCHVTKISEQCGLTLKGPARVGIGSDESFFQCDHAANTLVDRFVNCAHAALTQLAD